MASTIQLKTGTGSAIPSSLTQGEVGINIDNGLIYYGSGSTNTRKQLESFTNISASGDISASGNIFGEKLSIINHTEEATLLSISNAGGTFTINSDGGYSGNASTATLAATATTANGWNGANNLVLNNNVKLIGKMASGTNRNLLTVSAGDVTEHQHF